MVVSMSSFTSSGIPGVNGSYAYPPNSDMTKFIDGINNTVAAGTRNADGTSVVDWAQGLVVQSQIRKQQEALQRQQQAQQLMDSLGSLSNASASGDSTSMNQVASMLMALLNQLMSGSSS